MIEKVWKVRTSYVEDNASPQMFNRAETPLGKLPTDVLNLNLYQLDTVFSKLGYTYDLIKVKVSDGRIFFLRRGDLYELDWVQASMNSTTNNKVPKRFGKALVAKVLGRKIAYLEQTHGFTNETGWIQVDGRGEALNREYGEWDALWIAADLLDIKREVSIVVNDTKTELTERERIRREDK